MVLLPYLDNLPPKLIKKFSRKKCTGTVTGFHKVILHDIFLWSVRLLEY